MGEDEYRMCNNCKILYNMNTYNWCPLCEANINIEDLKSEIELLIDGGP